MLPTTDFAASKFYCTFFFQKTTRKVYKTLQVTLYLLLGIVHRKILRLTPMPISSGRHDRIAERRGGMFIKQLDESSAILYGSCLAVYHELRHVFRCQIISSPNHDVKREVTV